MKITDLSVRVGNFHLAVDSMEIEPGKIHRLIGHNGSGKTILLKTIMGIIEPEGGKINFGGISRKEMTMLSQRPYLLHSSVYENLIYPLKLRGITPNKERIDQMLERTGMAAQKNQYARSLSSGERQKLSFLRAIIFCPKFVMMDETLSNLDQENEESIISYIREIQEISPITWLIVSHQLDRKIDLFDVSHQMERGVYLGIVES